MNAITRYEEMRIAVERCARIDEAADIRDKATALQAYARQRDDRELDVWTSEIKLRASVRIGELVRELDSHQGERTDKELNDSSVAKSKLQDIKEAGLTPRTAQRYQELAGPKDEQAQAAGKAAAENYFAKARADRQPATMDGLKGAIKDAVHATIGFPPRRPKPKPVEPAEPATPPIGNDWVDWVSAIETIGSLTVDYASMAERTPVRLRKTIRREAEAALARIPEWINALEEATDVEAT